MIEASNLYKRFGDVTAVRDLSFRAEDGSITGLLGPNGAGKTTTLRILCTLLQPDGGSASIDGSDVVVKAHAARTKLGVLPDARGLYTRLSARENIRYYARLFGLDREVLEERINELVKALDMTSIVDRRAAGFSQGERMKVAIARALVHDPQNVVLDEPTNGLDVMSTRAMRDFIRGLRDQGRCVLFSSHIMQEVAALCDRIVVLSEGRVVAVGSPDALREQTGIASLEEVFVALTMDERYRDEAEGVPASESEGSQ